MKTLICLINSIMTAIKAGPICQLSSANAFPTMKLAFKKICFIKIADGGFQCWQLAKGTVNNQNTTQKTNEAISAT